MKTFTATNRAGEKLELYSDDTFTLAIGSPETESEETTPRSLFQIFDSVAIAGLLRECAGDVHAEEKLMAAWDFGDLGYAERAEILSEVGQSSVA